MESGDGEDEEDGQLFRSFFAESSDEEASSITGNEISGTAGNTRDEEESILEQNVIMGVPILQDKKAGIASQLWPAACHLANYLLGEIEEATDLSSHTSNTDTVDNSNSNNNRRDEVAAREMRTRLHGLLRTKLTPSATPLCTSLSPSLSLLPAAERTPLRVVELGAGVGLTGIKIAREVPGSHVVLTDLGTHVQTVCLI